MEMIQPKDFITVTARYSIRYIVIRKDCIAAFREMYSSDKSNTEKYTIIELIGGQSIEVDASIEFICSEITK